MKRLRTKAPDGLDNPARWYQYMRPWLDQERWQQRIDQLVGVSKDRKPIIRIVWGQDVTQRVLGTTELPRYWTKRRNENGNLTYYTVPRWMLEKRLEIEQYAGSWEEKRWGYQDENGTPIDAGPPPEEYYTFAYLIAEHEAINPSDGWPACCTRKFYEDRGRCWGRYKQPGDDDLELIAQAVRQMEADKFRNPYAPLTVQELIETEVAANMQAERAQEQFENYEQEMWKDMLKLHGHRLFEGPNSFHDMGQNFTREGDERVYKPTEGIISI
jgi:hypothetical protein